MTDGFGSEDRHMFLRPSFLTSGLSLEAVVLTRGRQMKPFLSAKVCWGGCQLGVPVVLGEAVVGVDKVQGGLVVAQ